MLSRKIQKTTGKRRAPLARSGRAVTPSTRVTPLPGRPRGGGQIRLAIATQPALLRDLLSRLLKQEPDIEVVGESYDEDRIVEAIRFTGRGYVFAVQWHPEWAFAQDPLSVAIFRAFGASL